MICFVDTSAILAILDADDKNHREGANEWKKLVVNEDVLLVSDYVLVESFALVQNRLGLSAVRTLNDNILPVLKVEWISESLFRTAVMTVVTAARKKT